MSTEANAHSLSLASQRLRAIALDHGHALIAERSEGVTQIDRACVDYARAAASITAGRMPRATYTGHRIDGDSDSAIVVIRGLRARAESHVEDSPRVVLHTLLVDFYEATRVDAARARNLAGAALMRLEAFPAIGRPLIERIDSPTWSMPHDTLTSALATLDQHLAA